MEAFIGLIVSLASGGAGGYFAGQAMPKFSLGTNGNMIAGIAGGLLGGTSIAAGLLGFGGEGFLGTIITNLVGGAFGGGLALPLASIVNSLVGKKD